MKSTVLKTLAAFVIAVLIGISNCYAAGATLSLSSSEVEPGGTVDLNVTLSTDSISWDISTKADNSTLIASSELAEKIDDTKGKVSRFYYIQQSDGDERIVHKSGTKIATIRYKIADTAKAGDKITIKVTGDVAGKTASEENTMDESITINVIEKKAEEKPGTGTDTKPGTGTEQKPGTGTDTNPGTTPEQKPNTQTSQLKLTPSATTVKSGEKVSVKFTTANLGVGTVGVSKISGTIAYDAKVFETLTKSDIALGAGWSIEEFNNNKLVLKSSSPVTVADAEIFTLNLKAKADATAGTTQVGITGAQAVIGTETRNLGDFKSAINIQNSGNTGLPKAGTQSIAIISTAAVVTAIGIVAYKKYNYMKIR